MKGYQNENTKEQVSNKELLHPMSSQVMKLLYLLDAKNVPGSTNGKNLHVGKGMEEKPINSY